MSADDGVPSSRQVGQILGSSKLASALENDRYKHLLDHVPVAVAISRGTGDQQHIVYINKAFEHLMMLASNDVEGQSWTCLDGFALQDSPSKTLGEAIRDGEDFIGVFRPSVPLDRLVIVQDESSADAAWVHAYLHRVEGDLGNAGYWYRQAGRPVATDSLESEWERIVAALLGSGKA